MDQHKKYSQFRAMLSLAKASLISTMRSPSAVVFTLAFPLIFIVVFGFIGGSGFKMAIAVDPQTDQNIPVFKGLMASKSINIIENESDKEINAELEKGTLDAWIKITNSNLVPAGKPHYIIDLKTSKGSADKGMIFKLILDETVSKMNLAGVPLEKSIAEIRAVEVQGRKYSMIDFILPGMLGFSILSTGVFGTAFVFFNLRQTLVLKRFFATPVKRGYIIIAEAISRIIFALIGALIIIVIGYFVFDFTLIHGVITILNMMLLSAIGLMVFLGFGFIVSGLARNDSTIPVMANMITMPQFLLSGTFFSVKAFPQWLQNISNILPLTHLNNALRKIAFEGAGLMDIGKPLLILAIWGIVIYIAAAKAFRWE